jgi:hypothetical protein
MDAECGNARDHIEADFGVALRGKQKRAFGICHACSWEKGNPAWKLLLQQLLRSVFVTASDTGGVSEGVRLPRQRKLRPKLKQRKTNGLGLGGAIPEHDLAMGASHTTTTPSKGVL